MITIIIADDHAIIREGLKQIVMEEPDMRVTGEACNASELMNMLSTNTWSIVVLDINMPGKSGLDTLKDIKSLYPKLPILILSMYTEEQYGIRAIKAGASGYLKKISAPNEFVKAIRRIVSGGKYISPELAEKIAENITGSRKGKAHDELSDREYEILCKIASGKTADEIAAELFISIHTVYSYRNRLLEKLKLKSNIELTRYALQNRIIEL